MTGSMKSAGKEGGMKCAIVTCSSLKEFVDAVQRRICSRYPVYVVDRLHHVEPERMKTVVRDCIAQIPKEYDTILIAMGFCGGVWDHVAFDRRIVIPRADDCVSVLLQTDDRYIPNRKEPGHLYLYESRPEDFSALSLMRDYACADPAFAGIDRDLLFHMWFDNYRYMDIIDTGENNCYDEAYVQAAQDNADQIGASLGYVEGGTRMLEKLLTGRWDDQFLVAEPGHMIVHGDFF